MKLDFLRRTKAKKANPRAVYSIVIIFVLLILSVVFLLFEYGTNQYDADETLPKPIFVGEYRIENGDWKPIEPGKHISATKGAVTLRGTLHLIHPENGEPIGALPDGTELELYCNHISVVISVSEQQYNISAPPIKAREVCGKVWNKYRYEANAGEIIEIRITNPHRFGNENAVDQFLNDMILLQFVNPPYHYRLLGISILVVSLIFLSVAMFSLLLHLKEYRIIWLIGMMVLAAGGHILFSDPDVSRWSRIISVNTATLILCMMLYWIFFLHLASNYLHPQVEPIGVIAAIISDWSAIAAILFSFHPKIALYDAAIYWMAIQIILALTMLGCALFTLVQNKKKNLFISLVNILIPTAFLIDIPGTCFGWWQDGKVSQCVFFPLFFATLIIVLNIVPRAICSTMQQQDMEARQKIIETQLKESRVSIMLSQIQPHFLYNTLNSIYYLCGKDSLKAQEAISFFSDYLRNNLDSINSGGMIPFSKELEHIKTYLQLEKIRFEDELEIRYDIKVQNFNLPLLTVQPLVENAVKHGLSKKRGGGCVSISTAETKTHFLITVSDTGKGFDPERYMEDGKTHIGIENVRQRLETICDGSLQIDSIPGQQTVATVRIPKKRRQCP